MIIAYPADVVDKLRPRPTLTYNPSPRSDPKLNRLTQVQVVLDKSNIGQIFPQGHNALLDGIKVPLKRQAEDMLEAESPKPTRNTLL
ncbi:hypothetical protein BGZ67_005528, partial [Mortierella alpina]